MRTRWMLIAGFGLGALGCDEKPALPDASQPAAPRPADPPDAGPGWTLWHIWDGGSEPWTGAHAATPIPPPATFRAVIPGANPDQVHAQVTSAAGSVLESELKTASRPEPPQATIANLTVTDSSARGRLTMSWSVALPDGGVRTLQDSLFELEAPQAAPAPEPAPKKPARPVKKPKKRRH